MVDKDSSPPEGHVVSLPPNPHAHHHYPPASYGHMMHPNPNMMLEHQFAQFGLHDSHNGSEHTASSNQATDSDNNDTENGGANEGEEYEGEPVKLFVGQVC